MDFGVLSKYDDLLASYFLDSFYLWFSTVRMNDDFCRAQVDTVPIVAIIRDQIVEQRDPSKAALQFLKMPYFQEYIKDMPEKRRIEFTQHLKRYMYMFMPNAGFEISSTDRYTGKMEACIVATRDWEAGEQVTCCQGAIAELNSEEDARLKKEGRDFSVMVSTRKKCTCLFLGPARFMNHDCDANCEFILLNQNAITFRIKRNIAEGEEMTVFYGEHYFGEDNCECLCASCEKRQEGSFSAKPDNELPEDENTIENSNNNNNSSNSSSTSNSGNASPAPSTNSSSSQRSNSKSNKNDSNRRRSSRKRKDVSYADYFEPIEPKKARKGRSAKTIEYEDEEIVEDKASSKGLIVLCQDNMDQAPIDMDIHDCYESQYLQKKLESTRQQEMTLSFICEDIAPSDDKCYQWIHISTYPEYNPVPYIKDKDIPILNIKELEIDVKAVNKGVPGESVIVPWPPLAPIKPIINSNIPQQDYEGSFYLDLQSMDTTDNKTKKKEGNNQELSLIFNWCDDLSDLSELEEEHFGPCCSMYNKETAVKETDMCVRCHRHYSIYGIRWPVRKIRKAPGKRRTHKKTHKQQRQPTPQQEPSPTSTVSTTTTATTPPSSLPILPPSPPPPPPLAGTSLKTTITTETSSSLLSLSSPAPLSIPSSPLLPVKPLSLVIFQPPPLPPPVLRPSTRAPPSLPSLPSEPSILFTHPTSPSLIFTADNAPEQQTFFSDNKATPMDDLRNRLSRPVYNLLNEDSLTAAINTTEELDKQEISSNRCSRQYNTLVQPLSVDLYRD